MSYVMVLSPISCIPGYAIYKLIITPGRTFYEVKPLDFEEEESNLFIFLASSTGS